jgi:hypothetical protein
MYVVRLKKFSLEKKNLSVASYKRQFRAIHE